MDMVLAVHVSGRIRPSSPDRRRSARVERAPEAAHGLQVYYDEQRKGAPDNIILFESNGITSPAFEHFNPKLAVL